MDTALSVSCSPLEILLAVARRGEVLVGYPERLEAPALLEESERLQGMLDRMTRTLEEVRPDVVRVLMPEQTYKASYSRIAPRATLETLVRLAALKKGIPVEMLARSTARSRLKLPRTGSLDEHMASIVASPVGKYWNVGRNLAAAAALAED